VALLAVAASAYSSCGWRAGAVSASPAAAAGDDAYRRRCGGCHDVFPPYAYSDAEWPAIVRRKRPDAGLTDAEVQELIEWLQSAN
jgi:hypothetical protein